MRKPKKIKTIENIQKFKFLCENAVYAPWPNYIGEKVRTLGKPYGIKLKINI
jgi:hypothetical protein